MKVKELIAKLQELDPEMPVMIGDYYGYGEIEGKMEIETMILNYHASSHRPHQVLDKYTKQEMKELKEPYTTIKAYILNR